MNAEEFDKFLDETLDRTRSVLKSKGDEYVPGDNKSRFHNFEKTAHLNDESLEQALWGFVSKQVVSLSDMVKVDSTSYSIAQWDEKTGDVLNYMILLRGIVRHKEKLALGFAVGENIEEHVVVVTIDDPEIHILPGFNDSDLPPEVQAYLKRVKESTEASEYGPDAEDQSDISTGAKTDQDLKNEAVSINSEAVKAAEEMTVDIRHDGTTAKVDANLAHIGIEFNSEPIGAGTSTVAITGTINNPNMRVRAQNYPDLSAYTGR
jgi:hypothetical protein